MPVSLPLRLLDRLRELGSPDLRTATPEQLARTRSTRVPDGPAGAVVGPLVGWLLGRAHPDAVVQDTTVPGADGDLPLRVWAPRTLPEDAPLVVHLHGGGFVVGGPALYDWWCSELAVRLGAVVASVDYRKAPEHPAPAAVDDAIAATTALLDTAAERFGATGPAAVTGDSAGGNLATLAALALRGDERLAAQWLVYPATDLTRSLPSHTRLPAEPFLPRESMDVFTEMYLAGGVAEDDPRVSPLLGGDPAGSAAALVQVATHDPLIDEGEAWAARLEAAGVPVRLSAYVDQPHGFTSVPGLTPAARQALEEGVRFLRRHLHPETRPDPR